MSKLSIYETNWIDLVFEGKNKIYGAYQLRQENEKTTITAFCIGLLLVASLAGIPMIAGQHNSAILPSLPALQPIDRIIHISAIRPEMPKTQKMVVPIAKKQKTDALPEKPLRNPVVVAPLEASPDSGKKTALPNLNPNSVEGAVTNSSIPTATSVNSGTETQGTDSHAVVNTIALDKLPEFPGGISRFYAYVGTHFEKPEIDEVKTVRVFVTFVIEKDGSMTDIQVRKDPGFGLGKEAIRVLKSLKSKWTPGILDGKPVRTAYNLPIVVEMK